MLVKRVATTTGSRIEPPHDDRWSHLKQLEWKAAVIEVDCGLRITIYDPKSATKYFGIWVRDIPRTYGISIPGSSAGAFSFSEAWTYMNGLEAGYRAGARTVEGVA